MNWFLFAFQLAQKLNPKQIEPGVAVATVKGKIVTRNNRHTLKPYEGGRKYEIFLCSFLVIYSKLYYSI